MADERGRIFIEPAQYTDLDRWHAVATEMRAEGPSTGSSSTTTTRSGRAGLPEIMEIEKNPTGSPMPPIRLP
jgi:hypothetical protein